MALESLRFDSLVLSLPGLRGGGAGLYWLRDDVGVGQHYSPSLRIFPAISLSVVSAGRGRAPDRRDLIADPADAVASLCHSNPFSFSPFQTRVARRRGSPKSDGMRTHPLTSRGDHYLCGGHNAPWGHTHVVAWRPEPAGTTGE